MDEFIDIPGLLTSGRLIDQPSHSYRLGENASFRPLSF